MTVHNGTLHGMHAAAHARRARTNARMDQTMRHLDGQLLTTNGRAPRGAGFDRRGLLRPHLLISCVQCRASERTSSATLRQSGDISRGDRLTCQATAPAAVSAPLSRRSPQVPRWPRAVLLKRSSSSPPNESSQENKRRERLRAAARRHSARLKKKDETRSRNRDRNVVTLALTIVLRGPLFAPRKRSRN